MEELIQHLDLDSVMSPGGGRGRIGIGHIMGQRSEVEQEDVSYSDSDAEKFAG